ncbi:MAG: protein kinase domain-containing protein [Methylococcales bacterium]
MSHVDDSTITKVDEVDSGLRVGMTLKNRFVLEKISGQGGMGTIFKARDLFKEKMEDRKPFVAIKVLHPKFQRNEDLIRALQREARKSQELGHPNIVNVHDCDEDGKYVFMVMEFLQGKPLNVLIDEVGLDKISLQDRWSMIEKIGRGIAYAHEKEVIHYDIKPGNVFICDDGNVKILDFGIAKALREPAKENPTVFDQYSPDSFTPAYASCEMFRWETPDVRDDVYAFGCVAYEILAGKHPFSKMPALKAAEAGLKPESIKGLTEAQWKSIKATLKFKREDRLPEIVSFLDVCFGPKKIGHRPQSFYLAAGIAIVVVVAVVIWRWPEIRCIWQPIVLEVSYKGGTDKLEHLSNDTTLHSGDRYKIKFTTKEDSYVYIFQIDSSQRIYQIFPPRAYSEPNVEGGNLVEAGRTYSVPAEDRSFELDNQVGRERIYPLAFRQRNTVLEELYREMSEAREQQDGSRFPDLQRQLVEMLEQGGCDTAGVFPFQHI